LLESRESFEMVQVVGFTKLRAKQALVEDLKMYDQELFDFLWEHIGNHPGTWFMAHNYLKSGEERSNVIKILQKQFFNDLSGMIRNYDKPDVLKDFLISLKKNNFKMKYYEHEAMNFFLDKNVLLFDGEVVSPQHELWRYIIEYYLKG